eukprot:gene8973-9905_t
MQAVFTKLYDAALLCRPRNLLRFANRFLQDSKNYSSRPEEAHALHFLPFLLFQPEEFQNHACTLFCAYLTGKSILLSNNGQQAQAQGQQDSTKSEGGGQQQTISLREYLDGPAMMEIIQAFDLPSLGIQTSLLEDLLMEKVEALKRIDFRLFLSILRLLFTLGTVQLWLRDEIVAWLMVYSPQSIASLPLAPETNIDMVKLRAHLKKSTETPLPNWKHGYHCHGLGKDENALLGSLKKLFVQVVEDEERASLISLESLEEKMLRQFLQSLPPSIS